MPKKILIVIGVLVILIIIFMTFFFLNKRSESEKAPLFPDQFVSENEISSQTVDSETAKVTVTKGIKHIVPLAEIIGGGPPKDGIPAIHNPKFISIKDASSFLNDSDPGISLELNGVKRFYPYKILVWHEIVNDTIKGQRVLVTYCPLCYSGIVFDPLVQGERVEFGTSGKLWNSNLVMYDRKTESLWSQVLGQAIVGEMAGNKLKVLPSDLVRFGEWKRINPDGEVLSTETGIARDYGLDPYGDYYTTPGIYFPVNKKDDRLAEKELIFGIEINGKFKAYFLEAVKRAGEVKDSFEGKRIILKYEKDIDVVRMFSDGERINPITTYWFSWVAAHPGTSLYK